MTRLLSALIVILAGLSPWAIGLSESVDCAEQVCTVEIIEIVEESCCGGSDEPMYCPMSDGPCVCGVSETPLPDRQAPAPLPSTNHPTLVTVLTAPPFMVDLMSVDTLHAHASGIVLSPTFSSHNQRQASLGVWRL